MYIMHQTPCITGLGLHRARVRHACNLNWSVDGIGHEEERRVVGGLAQPFACSACSEMKDGEAMAAAMHANRLSRALA